MCDWVEPYRVNKQGPWISLGDLLMSVPLYFFHREVFPRESLQQPAYIIQGWCQHSGNLMGKSGRNSHDVTYADILLCLCCAWCPRDREPFWSKKLKLLSFQAGRESKILWSIIIVQIFHQSPDFSPILNQKLEGYMVLLIPDFLEVLSLNPTLPTLAYMAERLQLSPLCYGTYHSFVYFPSSKLWSKTTGIPFSIVTVAGIWILFTSISAQVLWGAGDETESDLQAMGGGICER